MTRKAEVTKRRIFRAALKEFAAHGPHGTTIERIAQAAMVNKERVYHYFGTKHDLFSNILREELSRAARAVPLTSSSIEEVGRYAADVYDYHRAHPELTRLMHWEGLVFDTTVPDEEQRREHYTGKVTATANGQAVGVLTDALDADHLAFLVLSLASWWSAAPQVARMLTGPLTEDEHARRRASVIRAATHLATDCKPARSNSHPNGVTHG